MKRLFLALVLAALLSACAGGKEPENIVVELGEEVSTAFFDLEVTGVTACQGYQRMRAVSGKRLVLVEVEIENTSRYDMPMGRYDFRLMWGASEEAAVYPLEAFCEEQLPDAYSIPVGEEQEGLLVFLVPDDIKNLALGYLEIFEDDTQGDAYMIHFTI